MNQSKSTSRCNFVGTINYIFIINILFPCPTIRLSITSLLINIKIVITYKHRQKLCIIFELFMATKISLKQCQLTYRCHLCQSSDIGPKIKEI